MDRIGLLTKYTKNVEKMYNINEIQFFYKKSLILSENRDFGEKSKIRITICITI